MELFYKAPAANWLEALPLGNGRLGAMVYGDPRHETIQLNEESLWSGRYDPEADNPDCAPMLDEIRKAIFAGDYARGEELTNTYMICRGAGSGARGEKGPYGSYQTAGELHIDFTYADDTITDYSRNLDLVSGLASTRFQAGGAAVKGYVFTSLAAGVTICYYTSDAPFTASCRFTRDHAVCGADPAARTLFIKGTFPADPTEGDGLAYATAAKLYPTGGTLTRDGTGLVAKDVTALAIVLDTQSTYAATVPDVGVALCRDPEVPFAACLAQIDKYPIRNASDVEDLFSESAHILSGFMNRVQLELDGKDPALRALPTDERLRRMQQGESDTGLLITYFAFGRYLLVCSSYNCRLPANLQGIWADTYETPWSGDYHININLQMNYWLSETCNLGELNASHFDYIRFLSEHGTRTAKIQYGADGWCAHTSTTPWGFTAPGQNASWGSFMAAGAWCCTHIWERYAFSGDKSVLSDYIDVLIGACRFFMDYLVEDPRTGYYVTCPSNSPENHFRDPVTGGVCAICAGPAMDNAILRDLFTQTVAALELLGRGEDPLCDKLKALCAKLPPIQIGKHGQIMEWSEDFEETEPGHRHVSQLYALHPSAQITESTPELLRAAGVTLERRLSAGGGHTGWSRAWIVNFYARLGQGDKCLENLHALLAKCTLPNMFDNHPPFQIDGNFGGANGIAEMLLASHDGKIVLLPALPTDPAWASGKVTGLCARGGYRVDMIWKNRRVVRFTIHSTHGGPVTVRVHGKDHTYHTEAGRDLVCELLV